MPLDKAAVAHIATLARIRLSESELELLADELSHILTWVEQLNEVDTTGVTPMASAAAASSRAENFLRASPSRASARSSASSAGSLTRRPSGR